jgi:hypothetical protein
MQPTPEQTDAVDKFRKGGALKINAFAGTGKTTTLRLLSEASGGRGLYLAFNRSIAEDAKAKFPKNTTCSTIHSIAFRATRQAYRRGDKMTAAMNANAVASHLGYSDLVVDGVRLTPRSRGHLTLETLRKFMQGGLAAIERRHVPRLGKLEILHDDTLAKLDAMTVEDAMGLWRRMCDPADQIPLGHDGYLKMWALSRPRIAADFVLLDEAQDTNPVVLEVLRRQVAQIVYVGDRHQQIYEWRGAVNAMERIDTPNEAHLTTSFRFGDGIASAASRVLERLGETRALSGNPAVTSYIGCDGADAVVARTNASVISTVLRELQAGRAPHVIGGVGELVRMLRGVEYLKRGEPSDVTEFFGFENWNEVVEHTKTPEGRNLKTFVGLVESHGEARLIQKLQETRQDEAGADVVVSTAHKAKGREWDTVELADDFLPAQPSDDEDGPPRIDEAEIRLFYVALTRAKTAVEVAPAAVAQFGVTPGPRLSRAARPSKTAASAPQAASAGFPTSRQRRRAADATSSPSRPVRVATPPRPAPPTRAAAGGGTWIWIALAIGVLWLVFR